MSFAFLRQADFELKLCHLIFQLTLVLCRGIDHVATRILPCNNCDIAHRESVDVLRSCPHVPPVLIFPLLGNEVSLILDNARQLSQGFTLLNICATCLHQQGGGRAHSQPELPLDRLCSDGYSKSTNSSTESSHLCTRVQNIALLRHV